MTLFSPLIKPKAAETNTLLETQPLQGVQSALPFIDARAVKANETSLLLQSPSGIWGVGLHGACNPGTFLVVTPSQNKATIQRILNTTGWAGIFDSLSRGSAVLLGDVAVVYPGDAVRFPQPLGLGCIAFVGNFLEETTGLVVDTSQPIELAPMVRWYTQDPGPVSRIGYFKTPFARETTMNAAVPSGATGTAITLGPTVTRLTVHAKDGLFLIGPEAALTGGQEIIFEVWWRMANGLWVHNDADDWDDAGRGRGNANHTVETYTIPRSARAVYFRQITNTGLGSPAVWAFMAEE